MTQIRQIKTPKPTLLPSRGTPIPTPANTYLHSDPPSEESEEEQFYQPEGFSTPQEESGSPITEQTMTINPLLPFLKQSENNQQQVLVTITKALDAINNTVQAMQRKEPRRVPVNVQGITFNGGKDAELFIKQLDNLIKSGNWSPAEARFAITQCLKDSALEWFLNLPEEEKSSWDRIKNNFIKVYTTEVNVYDVLKELVNSKQSPSINIEAHAAKIKYLLARTGEQFSEKAKMKYLWEEYYPYIDQELSY